VENASIATNTPRNFQDIVSSLFVFPNSVNLPQLHRGEPRATKAAREILGGPAVVLGFYRCTLIRGKNSIAGQQ
jgi:hypothetical protein